MTNPSYFIYLFNYYFARLSNKSSNREYIIRKRIKIFSYRCCARSTYILCIHIYIYRILYIYIVANLMPYCTPSKFPPDKKHLSLQTVHEMTNPRNSGELLKLAVDRSNERLQLLLVDNDSVKTLEYYYLCSMLASTWRVLLRRRTSLENALSSFLADAHEIHNAANVYHPMIIGCVCMCVCAWCRTRETTQPTRLACVCGDDSVVCIHFLSRSLFSSSHFRIYSDSCV